MAWFVPLPDFVQISIGVLVLALVNLGVRALLNYVPWLGNWVNQYKDEWAAAISLWLISLLQNALPEAYPDISILAVQLVVAVLMAVLAKIGLRKLGVRAFM